MKGLYRQQDLKDALEYRACEEARLSGREFEQLTTRNVRLLIDDEAPPEELARWLRKYIPKAALPPIGWLAKVAATAQRQALSGRYHRSFIGHIRRLQHGEIAPVIVIDDMLCDGVGRALLHHGLGRSVRVSRFERVTKRI